MDKSDFIPMDVSRETLMRALSSALSMRRFSDNLRDRDYVMYVDNMTRGLAAQTAAKLYLQKCGVRTSSPEKMSPDGDVDMEIAGKGRNATAEVKSSLLPCRIGDDPDMSRLPGMGMDIKMIARTGDAEKDITRDLYIQIYFSVPRAGREQAVSGIDVSLYHTTEELYEAMGLDAFLNSCFLVGWTTGHAALEHLKSLPPEERQWAYGKRSFWRCPLSLAYPPRELAEYVRSL